MKAAIFLLFLSFLGCATAEKYEQKLKAWVGSPSDNLVRQWGAPTSTMTMQNGKTVYTYNHSGGTAVFNNGYYLNAIPVECKTDFFINEIGIIDGYFFQGNACKSR